jgi:hypothetical protein
MSWIAMAVGGFYVVAGAIVLRAMKLDELMDGLLQALEGKPASANEHWRSAILTAGAYLTLGGGAALATLSAFALPLFLANTVVQGGYLLWAARALPPGDADEAKGRKQTTNAFAIYAAACAFVVWLSVQGGLRAWPGDIEGLAMELLAVVGITIAGWASIYVPNSWFSRKAAAEGSGITRLEEDEPVPTNLRLSPDWQRWPLWDADTGVNVSHYRLNLPDRLAERIETWDDTWQATYNGDDPSASGFDSGEQRQAYREEGRLIALELKRLWPGRIEVADEFC